MGCSRDWHGQPNDRVMLIRHVSPEYYIGNCGVVTAQPLDHQDPLLQQTASGRFPFRRSCTPLWEDTAGSSYPSPHTNRGPSFHYLKCGTYTYILWSFNVKRCSQTAVRTHLRRYITISIHNIKENSIIMKFQPMKHSQI